MQIYYKKVIESNEVNNKKCNKLNNNKKAKRLLDDILLNKIYKYYYKKYICDLSEIERKMRILLLACTILATTINTLYFNKDRFDYI